ncbi:hypothetical protein HYALB_00006374 [Hymenoscyphus albidus]|uniref:Very long-chain fatty acid transport protein n=1 Tax=Hymenoscyphus albidus TaxID=595503 RepID=A0A9N9LDA3_9HELO|nr:hypothetical protein HYALB_00006374 [Hymenoscyphus albidus]
MSAGGVQSINSLAMGRLNGKNAIVTGAAGGIGLETCILFSREGANVLMADISAPALEKAIAKLQQLVPSALKVETKVCDVSKEAQIEALVGHLDSWGGVDIMFNNAGIMHSDDADAVDTPEKIWDLTQAINVKGVWFGCKHAILSLRKHKKTKGSIINTASVVALVGSATPQLAYTASKGAVLAMTRELAIVHARDGYRFNALCPAPLNTPLLQDWLGDDKPKRLRREIHFPSGRFGEAIEQANAVLFLASDESGFINGQDFVVDGGMTKAYVTPEGPPLAAPKNNALLSERVDVTAAAVAGTAAAGMYLDGKYHFRKDIYEMMGKRVVEKMYQEAVKNKRQSLYYLFEEMVQKLPDHEAIGSRVGCYTYAETYKRANQYAHFFLSQGVKPKDYVAFYLTNSPDFLFAWLGLWAIGAEPAMINHNLAGKALIHCLRLSGATILLVDEDEGLRAKVEGTRTSIEGELGMNILVCEEKLMGEIRSLSTDRLDDIYRQGVKGNWPRTMFYISETTGLPKGVAFQMARHFFNGASYTAGYSLLRPHDRWYDCMPLYHGTGGVTAIGCLMNGLTVCVGKKFSTSNFWRDIHDFKATFFVYVGETARYLLAAPPSPFDKGHNLRGMYGNGLRPDVWIKFRERFDVPEVAEFFNSSEGVFALINYAKGDYLAACVGHHGLLNRRLFHNIFVPVVIDEVTGAIARHPKTGFAYRQPYEKGGEIIVQIDNPAVFAGYHNNPEATAKKFESSVFKKGDLWYRCGDALRRKNDGRWFFLDQVGDTFRWKGENVSTAEVAEVLGNYPGVVEANIYGVQLPNHDGRAGCAAIYLDPSKKATFDFAGLLK